MKLRGKLQAVVGVLALLMVSAACVPPDELASWHETRFAFDYSPWLEVNHSGAWASDEWFASVRYSWSPTSGVESAALQFWPRNGAAGVPSGPPIDLPVSSAYGGDGGFFALPTYRPPLGGRSIVAVQSGSTVEFFRLEGGTWAAAGAATVQGDVVGVSDRWMLTRQANFALTLHELTVVGSDVVATAFPKLIESTIANAYLPLAFEGDLLAVQPSYPYLAPPAAIRLFRATEAGLVEVAAPAEATGDREASGLAVDDGIATDQVAVLRGDGEPRAIDVFTDDGGGFALEQHLDGFDHAGRDPASRGDTSPIRTGQFDRPIAVDGDRLAVVGRPFALPRFLAIPVTTSNVLTFERGSTWHRVGDLPVASNVFTELPNVGVSMPASLQISGDHVAVSMVKWRISDMFIVCQCLDAFGTEAWSFDLG